MFRRLRRRLDRVEGHAHATLNSADASIQQAAKLIAAAVRDLADDIQDGFTISIVRKPDGASIWQFLNGERDDLGLSIKVEIDE